MKEKFWMVWVEGQKDPKVKHDYKEKALKEAVRLSSMFVGSKVFVMEAVYMVRTPKSDPVIVPIKGPCTECEGADDCACMRKSCGCLGSCQC